MVCSFSFVPNTPQTLLVFIFKLRPTDVGETRLKKRSKIEDSTQNLKQNNLLHVAYC